MDPAMKKQIGERLRRKREEANYTREKLGELCSLCPRFIANVEFGESTFSLDSLMSVCRALSCSCDYLLFGTDDHTSEWAIVSSKLEQLDRQYLCPVGKMVDALIEAIDKSTP